jgi:hypothetical protein
VRKGDGKDVHHVDGNPLNTASRNIRVLPRSTNRKMNRKVNKKRKR